MVQVPAATVVRTPMLVIVQTALVDEVNVTASPLVDVAVKVLALPNTLVPGLVKVIVCVFSEVVMPVEAEDVNVPFPKFRV